MRLAIVNTRCANLASVRFAFERLGVQPIISADPDVLHNVDHVVLPGVGTASEAMSALQELEVIDALTSRTQPTLGICLGMQLLATLSHEKKRSDTNASIPCLDLIPTEVARLATTDNLPLPHMGWNATQASAHPLFKGLENPYFYYVHSFAAPLSEFTIARCEYGQAFSAAIARGPIMGVQFHPERSGKAGARVLKNFLEMTC
ncbi:MAG: imidazole glycerol phosphate synthase glutamine amidotransferase subunit HisH [Idiomarinaceae bacterium HL-53]|nr:MAG: imidazole glycerol phosphate synthase glutamine amidotransferase subunit HisH [Idiomarinaceae bacterium HL-53]CUS48580.1 imidazole glycerol phosphate synthase subunit hisH [Idiomarinaceae bacterium HL-53]